MLHFGLFQHLDHYGKERLLVACKELRPNFNRLLLQHLDAWEGIR